LAATEHIRMALDSWDTDIDKSTQRLLHAHQVQGFDANYERFLIRIDTNPDFKLTRVLPILVSNDPPWQTIRFLPYPSDRNKEPYGVLNIEPNKGEILHVFAEISLVDSKRTIPETFRASDVNLTIKKE